MQLVDTNIISELLRPRPNPAVQAWANRQEEFALAAISVEESMYGLVRNRNPALLEAYQTLLSTRCHVLPMSVEIAHRAGTLRGDFSLRGMTRSQADMLIAATAQQHNLTLVTRNTRDFEGCGISLLNPFTD
jgi:predicted nucleic acid-binding protein